MPADAVSPPTGEWLGPFPRRTFLKGLAGVAGAVALGGCSSGRNGGGGGGASGPTLRLMEWTGLGFPSAFTYVAGPGYWRMSLLFDTLTWPDSTGDQLPWLASSYNRSEDGLTYTAELREATWSDGKPVTAGDVVFTYDTYASQTFTPLLVGVPRYPDRVADVVATGERSVEFRLSQPDATFEQFLLGTMPIVPEHVFSTIPDLQATFDERTEVGTGAYSLESRNVNQGSELYVAKPGYFLGDPFVKRIEMVYFADPVNAVRLGDLSGAATPVEGVRNEALAPFRDDPQYGIVSQQGGWGFPLFFNMDRGGALADLRFRRACLHAIDRNDIVNRLLTGNGEPGSQGFLSPQNAYYQPVRDYPFDRGEAERLLDEAGYRRSGSGPRRNPNGSPLRYTLFMSDSVPIALAELIEANLEAVGIDIDLQRIDLVRLFGTKLQAAYDLLLTSYPGPSGIGPNGDPEQLRGIYASRPPTQFQKATGYSNPEVDRLLNEQLAAVTFDRRKQLVGQIQQLVAEDLPVAMLYYTTMYFVFRKNVFDEWYYTPGGFGPGISDVYNKQPYITGRKTGTEIA